MKQTLAIVRKEISSYFGTPMAVIFIGIFLLATLFVFFWVDTFFARGIADVRSLFRWMPLLQVFLIAALTMRQWSDEAQTGTLEVLLTLPVRIWQLVLGKFLAVMTLVALALALTLALPFTAAWLGDLDWGPVIGGYLAALLLAAAYTAIGLFVSSRTDNQIVALILTVLIGGLFYFVGARTVTEFFGESVGGILRALSTTSHFESIERGVIDLRDLTYYLSLTLVFLALNALALDAKRWSRGEHTVRYRRNALLAALLIAANLVALNGWIQPLNGLRIDLTEQREYTLSNVTKDLLGTLDEPLLIRAYFSERTHPLLAPLVPRIEDMLREYEVAGGGKVELEVIDPAQNPELEAEANQTYGIRPTPFQIAGRYESSVVNAYFDILVRYGDQNEVLNFRDLIEVETYRDGEIDVRLRNLEYDLTRAVKKSVFGFQSVDAVLASLPDAARLTLLITPDTLPEDLIPVESTVRTLAEEYAARANGMFSFEVINPDSADSPLSRQELFDLYGVQPFALSLFSEESYYLHMLLQVGDQIGIIYPSGDLTEADLRSSIDATLKRAAPGFLKAVGLWQPVIAPDPMMAQLGQTGPPPFSTWNRLSAQLQQEYSIQPVDLSRGIAPSGLDVLVLVAPQNMSDLERYAVDQYLMRGGALVIAGSNYRVAPDPFQGTLALAPIEQGMRDLLLHYGVDVQNELVLDPQNEPFPIAVERNAGGFVVQELQSLDYPYFVDVRSDGMSTESPVIANLPAVTLNWVSPVNADAAEAAGRTVDLLLQSSEESWTSANLSIQPDTETYPELGFPIEGVQQSYPLAVAVQGSFESFYADKEPPAEAPAAEGAAQPGPLRNTVTQSPDSARLIVIGSGDFVNDTVIDISSQLSLERYLNSIQLIQNSVDWSVEDLDLLTIRSRGAFTRLLDPLEQSDQTFWEYANYGFVLLALIIIGLLWTSRRRSEQPMRLSPRPEIADQM